MRTGGPPATAGAAAPDDRRASSKAAATADSRRDRDADLVARCKNGDTAAVAELLAAYRQPVQRYCLSVLKDPLLADEAAQETFVRVIQRLPTFDGGSAIGHYIMRVARFRCLDLVTERTQDEPSAARGSDVPAAAAADRTWDPAVTVTARDTLQRVWDGLSEGQRDLLRARHLHGEMPQDIARRTNSTPGSVSSQLNRARRAAVAFATSTGLAAIAPIAWLRDLTGRLRAIRPQVVQASASLAVAGVVAGFGSTAPPQNTMGMSGDGIVQQAHSAAHEAGTDQQSESWQHIQGIAETSSTPTRTTPDHAGESGTGNPFEPPPPVVELPENRVPVTGDRIHQTPPERHDTFIEVTIDDSQVVGVGVEDDEETAPAHDPACTAADTLPTTDCTTE